MKSNEVLWVDEGYVLDEAANLIATAYVDVRPPSERPPIRTLLKAGRQEHALEDAESILISPIASFRTEGGGLIRDKQEGFATVETESRMPETPGDVFDRRQAADLEEAVELLDSRLRVTRQVEHSRVRRSRKSLAYGREWWIYSTGIKPETDEELMKWRWAVDPTYDDVSEIGSPAEFAYDHVSEIGQPAKFAQALARMVTEQLGPQIDAGWLWGSIGHVEGEVQKVRRPVQLVIHGPVVYTDSPYDTLTQEAEVEAKIAALLFTKSKRRVEQREYRFVVLRDRAVVEKVPLTISGMMRDALQPGTSALVRPAPQAEETADTESSATSETRAESGERRATAKLTRTRRQTMRSLEGGVVVSSESTERVDERTVTLDDPGETWDPSEAAEAMDAIADDINPYTEQSDEDAVREIAFGRDSDGGETESGVGMRGTGSIDAMLERMFTDPAMPASSKQWAEDKLSREEIVAIFGLGAMLAHKILQVALEHREAASSASWHAIQCIHNINVWLGDIVRAVSIEQQRFVVLHLKASESGATGRIVVAPSGPLAYSFETPSGGKIDGLSESQLGKVFFPLGCVDKFDSCGWTPKDD